LSREAPMGLTIVEKLIGLTLLIVGAITVYVTYTNPPIGQSGKAEPYTSFFMVGGFLLISLGVFLMLAKAE